MDISDSVLVSLHPFPCHGTITVCKLELCPTSRILRHCTFPFVDLGKFADECEPQSCRSFLRRCRVARLKDSVSFLGGNPTPRIRNVKPSLETTDRDGDIRPTVFDGILKQISE